jgi:hypothetical protein
VQYSGSSYDEIRKGFLAAIGGALAAGVIGLCLWLVRHIAPITLIPLEWIWNLIPTGKAVWPISLGLFAGGLFGLVFAFCVIVRRVFRHIGKMHLKLKAIRDGKLDAKTLSLEELEELNQFNRGL